MTKRGLLVHAVLITATVSNATSAQSGARSDTIDVAVGSPVVDFSKHTPGSSRAVQQTTRDGATQTRTTMWHFAFGDSAGRALLFVTPESPAPAAGMPAPPSQLFIFDRRSLELLEIRNRSNNSVIISASGTNIHGAMPGPNGPTPLSVTLPAPAFFGPLSDLVAESLPHKVGAVYRVPLWNPGQSSSVIHLYCMTRREDVTVLGHAYSQAYVLEDRSADGRTLFGTMWLTDKAPHLVRWTINNGANGAVSTQLDQEAGPP